MIWGGFGVIDIVRFPLSLLPRGEGLGCEWLSPLSLLPQGEGSGMRESLAPPSSQREKGSGASLPLRRPVYVVGQREREKLRIVARRVQDGPRALARDVLILTRPAQQCDDAALRPFVAHENLVAVAVGLNARAAEGVTRGPRLRFLHAADREIVQKLRSVARLHDAGAFGGRIGADRPHVDDHRRAADRIGREFRRAARWKRVCCERG